MPKFLVLFNIDREAMARFVERPENRRVPAAQLAEAAGGRLLDYYWMFGQYDGLAIFEFPDAATAAAVSMMGTSSGAFSHFETHKLIDAEDLVSIAGTAQRMRPSYRPPGA